MNNILSIVVIAFCLGTFFSYMLIPSHKTVTSIVFKTELQERYECETDGGTFGIVAVVGGYEMVCVNNKSMKVTPIN